MRIFAWFLFAYAVQHAHALNGTSIPGNAKIIILSTGTTGSGSTQMISLSIKPDKTDTATRSKATISGSPTTDTSSDASAGPSSSQFVEFSNSTGTTGAIASKLSTTTQTSLTAANISVSDEPSSLLSKSGSQQPSEQSQSGMSMTSSSHAVESTSQTTKLTSQNKSTSTDSAITSEVGPSSSSIKTLVATPNDSSSQISTKSASVVPSMDDLTLKPSLTASSNDSGVVSEPTLMSDALSATLPSSISPGSGDATAPLLLTPTEGSSTTSSDIAESSGSITITSTMTALPTGVSMESRTDITTNTWITTSESGSESTTVVPVIWCPNCGTKGAGVVVWNFPPPPGVVFKWPGLPTFQFPCIPLPFKPCSDPPETDTEQSKEDDEENENDDEDGDEEEKQSSSTETPSETQSEACTTTTASDCSVACSAFLTRRDAEVTQTITTKCYTTKCVQTTGCSATSITSTFITTATTAPGPSCAFDTATNYNAKASYEAMGISVPVWLQEPLTAIIPTPSPGKPKVTDADSGNDATATSIDGSMTDLPSSTAASTTPSSTRETSSTRTSKSSIQTTSTASAVPSHSVSDATCRARDEFPNHGAVQPDLVYTKSAEFCAANLETTMQVGSEPVREQSQESGVSYDYQVEWIEHCTLESSDNEQNIHYPTGLSDNDHDKHDCYSLFNKAFACDNGGIGGHVDVGCLRYSFTGAESTEDNSQESDDSPSEPPSGPTPESAAKPLQPENLQCHSLDDFHKKNDVKRGTVSKAATAACEIGHDLDVSHPLVITNSYDQPTGFLKRKDVHYLYTYEWIPDCIGGLQGTQDPAGTGDEDACHKLFLQTYDDCTGNEGIGGSIDVGCLRYSFHGGLDDTITAELSQRGGTSNGITIGKR